MAGPLSYLDNSGTSKTHADQFQSPRLEKKDCHEFLA
jgi:hypothetical protein